MKAFVTIGGRECGACGGTGILHAPPHEGGGDVVCFLCHGAGVLEQRLVPLADALADCGILDRLAALESAVRQAERAANRAAYNASALANGISPD